MQYQEERNLPGVVERVVGRGSMLFIDAMTIAERVSKLMHERDRSQTWLERQTGISQSAISRFLRGEQRLYVDQAVAISQALEVSLDELVGLDALAKNETPEDAAIRAIVRVIGRDEALRRLARDPGQVTLGNTVSEEFLDGLNRKKKGQAG